MSRKAAGPPGSEPTDLREAVQSVLESASPATRRAFVTAVHPDPDDVNAELWGPSPGLTERREAALATLRRQYDARRRVLADSLTRPEAAKVLEISQQAVLDRLKAGDLVGLKLRRAWRFPTWQFSADVDRGIVPGISQLLEVFAGRVVTLTEWVTRPNVELDYSTPATELAAGSVDAVVAAAQVASMSSR